MKNITYEFEKKERFFIFCYEKPVFDRIYKIYTDFIFFIILFSSA